MWPNQQAAAGAWPPATAVHPSPAAAPAPGHVVPNVAPLASTPIMEQHWNQQAAFFQSMPANQVDWAALAQQWIAYKTSGGGGDSDSGGEALGSADVPPLPPGAPPMGKERASGVNATLPHEGGGEANMDVEDESESAANSTFPPVYTTTVPQQTKVSGYAYPGKDIPADAHVDDVKSHGHSRHQRPQAAPTMPQGLHLRHSYSQHHHHAQPLHQHHHHHHHQHADHKRSAAGFTNWEVSGNESEHSSAYMTANIDAAARKKLPLWIREGLEKMEREKHKREEMEKRAKLREETLKMRAGLEMADSHESDDPTKSKFDEMNSDDDDTDEADKELDRMLPGGSDNKLATMKTKKSRFSSADETLVKDDEDQIRREPPKLKRVSPQRSAPVSKEEILQEMNLVLRRTLTEVLLEVTSEEIEKVAKLVRAQPTRETTKPKVKLGKLLSGYGEGSSSDSQESDMSENESNDKKRKGLTSDDSDLENRVRRLKQSFSKVEERINAECIDREQKYLEREKMFMNDAAESDGDGDIRRKNRSKSRSPHRHDNPRSRSPKLGRGHHRSAGRSRRSTSNSRSPRRRGRSRSESPSNAHERGENVLRENGREADEGASSEKTSSTLEDRPRKRKQAPKTGSSPRLKAIKTSSRSSSSDSSMSASYSRKRKSEKRKATRRSSSREDVSRSRSRERERQPRSRRSPSKERHKKYKSKEKRSRSRSSSTTRSSRRSRSRGRRSRSRGRRSRSRHRKSERSRSRDRRSRSRDRRSRSRGKRSGSRNKRSRSREKRFNRRRRSRSRSSDRSSTSKKSRRK